MTSTPPKLVQVDDFTVSVGLLRLRCCLHDLRRDFFTRFIGYLQYAPQHVGRLANLRLSRRRVHGHRHLQERSHTSRNEKDDSGNLQRHHSAEDGANSSKYGSEYENRWDGA